MGMPRFGTWKPAGYPIKIFLPVIIDKDTYWRAQRAMQGRRAGDGQGRRDGRHGTAVTHLFLGLGKCTRCSNVMHVQNKGPMPKGGIYFICSKFNRRAGCVNDVRWHIGRIERRLLRGLAYIDARAVLSSEIQLNGDDG